MENDLALVERIHAVLSDSPVLFFFAVHLTVGRTFSLLTGLWIGLPPLALVGLAWIGDMLNIPFFVTIYELAHRGLRLSPTIARWLDRSRAHLERRGIYTRFARMGAIGVVLIAATPLWGCGMWSAILLAWSMRMKRLPGSLLLTAGSLIGSAIVLSLATGARLLYYAL
jgi:uncharacterized membrane protein